MGPLSFLLASLLGTAALSGAAEPPTAGAPPAKAVLAAVGDIRLDGPVGEIIARRGAAHPLSAVRGLLQADILFGNLECSITTRGEKRAKKWNFRARPESLESLSKGGFNVLNLANNHSMDYGEVGLADTLAALRKRGFLHVGGGRDRREAEELRVITAGGLKVGFLGFTSTFPKEAWARRKSPGVASSDFNRFPDLIGKARRECDVLVVSFHGGSELAEEPNEVQRAFARAAVDAGADLVLGHHPHVLQAVEVYKGKPILHSLGNFLFVSPTPSTRTTVIAKAVLTADGVEIIDFVPLDTNWGRPIPAGEEGRRAAFAALDRLGALSAHPGRFRLAP